MNRRQDSRMISEMKEQLRRLQERRQELESRQVDEEEALGQKSIVPHLARVMRDRQWAQVRSMIQSNMDSIDQDIQNAIGRLGAALLETGDPERSPRRSQRHFPDLIPRKRSQSPPKPNKELEPLHSFTSQLPQPGSPSRQALLEAVKETLERRKKLTADNEEEKTEQSPRVGFYRFRHETVAAVQVDKLSRLSVQKLPSVTIATQKPDRPLNHVISVQSPSIASPICHHTADSVELLTEHPNTSATAASSSSSIANHQQEEQTSPNFEIQPDDVARLFCDLLATQLELAVDSIGPIQDQQPASPRQCQRDNDEDNDDNEFRLKIDSCTQTTICNVKDSSTMMERWHQIDRSVETDRPISPESDPEEKIMQVSNEVEEEEEEEEEKKEKVEEVEEVEEIEEPLTPPRTSCINIVPDPAPPLDLNLWRRRYPPTPPSSCFESLIRQVEAAAHESLSNMTAVGSSSSSSSDATGILSSSLSTNASSSSATVAVSWLSEGEVPNRVASPGQIVVKKRGVTENIMDRSAEATLSEGQIPLRDSLPQSNFQLTSTLIDGSSQGEILLTQTSRSDSTASFRSATGSLGEIPAERFSNTDDDLESE